MLRTTSSLAGLSTTLSLLFIQVHRLAGHGMLTDPPARNAMWRFGFNNPVNYNDNELYCGGFSVQWQNNEGKCGVCGDRYDTPEPRDHEAGGRYGNGIIGRRYTMGQTIDVEIDISANHWGHFELKICPTNGRLNEATQECFDANPLVMTDNPRSHQFYVPLDSPKITKFNYKVNLPFGVTCSQCVMQWTYYTGNTWGVCANGTEGMGCGAQEMFRNCADVQINSIVGAFPPLALSPVGSNAFRTVYTQNQAGSLEPLVVTARVCLATPAFKDIPGMNDMCQKRCLSYPPDCPENECYCLSHCAAKGRLKGVEGTDVYCHRNCLRYPPNCPEESCQCFPANSPARGSPAVPINFSPVLKPQYPFIITY